MVSSEKYKYVVPFYKHSKNLSLIGETLQISREVYEYTLIKIIIASIGSTEYRLNLLKINREIFSYLNIYRSIDYCLANIKDGKLIIDKRKYDADDIMVFLILNGIKFYKS